VNQRFALWIFYKQDDVKVIKWRRKKLQNYDILVGPQWEYPAVTSPGHPNGSGGRGHRRSGGRSERCSAGSLQATCGARGARIKMDSDIGKGSSHWVKEHESNQERITARFRGVAKEKY
jgi:hypothetical protein